MAVSTNGIQLGGVRCNFRNIANGKARLIMKRDLDLIRQIMLALEQNSDLNGRSTLQCSASELVPLPGHDDDELAYQLMQIIDEGWLDGKYLSMSGSFLVSRLTADGHDFIDSTRNPDVWDRAKSATKAAGSETLRFVWEAAKSLARAELTRRLGPLPP